MEFDDDVDEFMDEEGSIEKTLKKDQDYKKNPNSKILKPNMIEESK